MPVTKEDGTVIAENIERADTLLKQIVGLMFRKSIPDSYAMVFSMKRDNRDGLHMMFMHFPIDVVFLDREKKIISIHRNLKPWTGMAFSSKPFRYVIELPAGTIDRASLKEGERLSW